MGRVIDFSFAPEVEAVRMRVRDFMDSEVRPQWDATNQDDRKSVVKTIVQLRERARTE